MKIEFKYKENAVVECAALLSVPEDVYKRGETAMIHWAYKNLDNALFTTTSAPITSSMPYAMEVCDED